MLLTFGAFLNSRFERTGSMDDLNRAISVVSDTVDATPLDHQIRATGLNDLGNWLGSRFERTGSMDDLNRAISVVSDAVDATPPDHPGRAIYLSNLGIWLGSRSERTGSMDDLDRAVSVTSDAVDAAPLDHPNRAMYLNNLGIGLSSRFERTGSMHDLNRAISVASDAVDATPLDHLHRAGRLHNLGNLLGRRFERTGSMDDLNRAVSVASDAVEAAPLDHLHRATCLNNLGAFLNSRFERTGSMDDLNRAVSVTSDAVDAAPLDLPNRAEYLNNFGNWLGRRFERTGSMDDINRAVSVASDAVNATPLDHPDRAGHLNSLGFVLGSRFDCTGSMDDINLAISLASDAVDATPPEHYNRAGLLNNLGNHLRTRFKRTGSMDDLNRGLALHTESWNCISASPSIRIISAQQAASVLLFQENWERAYQLLRDAVLLLPTVSPRSSNRSDVQASLATFFGLASTAAAAALNAGKTPEDALQLLELGRGVIASLLMDMRGDITDLRQQHPDLAEKFILLRDELDSPTHDVISPTAANKVSSWEIRAKRRRETDRELSEVIGIIRAQPGYSYFLQPPTAEELMSATHKGPIVVVNISSFRCDAFLIQPDSIQVVALPDLNQVEVRRRVASLSANSNLSPVLEWLWLVICQPILNALDLNHTVANDDWPHIWWIPTGLLSQLPLHAAGIHTQATGETVLDRAISSYASSIKALLHGRKHGIQQLSQTSIKASALMVAMQETPGLGERGRLDFANPEVEMLKQLCPQLHLAPTEPLRHKDKILKHLSNCKIFHFAGHGNSDPKDPSRSCLLLDDWETNPLTVEEVRDSRLQDNPPFLAYLSACSTGANRAATLADEGIHLISAFQLAGFRHVVGTLWEVSDEHCVDAARILYETLQEEGITDEAVSRGLHQAVTTLRNQSIRDGRRARDVEFTYSKVLEGDMIDYSWVPYVHFSV